MALHSGSPSRGRIEAGALDRPLMTPPKSEKDLFPAVHVSFRDGETVPEHGRAALLVGPPIAATPVAQHLAHRLDEPAQDSTSF